MRKLLAALFLFSSILLAGESLPEFMERVYSADSVNTPDKWNYRAEEVVTHFEDASRTEVESRVTTVKDYVMEDGEIVSEKVISREVEGEESDSERPKGNDREEPEYKMPFSDDSRDEYDYSDLGTMTLRGETVRQIGFEPVEEDDEYVRGSAWFEVESAEIRRFEFQPVDYPFAVKYLKIRLDFERIGEYIVPVYFDMQLSGKILFLAKFNIRVQQTKSDIDIIQ